MTKSVSPRRPLLLRSAGLLISVITLVFLTGGVLLMPRAANGAAIQMRAGSLQGTFASAAKRWHEPIEVLMARVTERNRTLADGAPRIDPALIPFFDYRIQRPDAEELALFD